MKIMIENCLISAAEAHIHSTESLKNTKNSDKTFAKVNRIIRRLNKKIQKSMERGSFFAYVSVGYATPDWLEDKLLYICKEAGYEAHISAGWEGPNYLNVSWEKDN